LFVDECCQSNFGHSDPFRSTISSIHIYVQRINYSCVHNLYSYFPGRGYKHKPPKFSEFALFGVVVATQKKTTLRKFHHTIHFFWLLKSWPPYIAENRHFWQ
ncbi:MAG TPA: hypothetical protein VEK38_00060, partial [Candidatus Bathyarchaeia archaeon]|nr:hypothetical protein [Candidatus Bathyarchaeia archaeon]